MKDDGDANAPSFRTLRDPEFPAMIQEPGPVIAGQVELERSSASNRRAPCGQPAAGHWDADFRCRIQGRRVMVEPVAADRDAADVHAAAKSGEDPDGIWRYLGYGPFADTDAMRKRLSECERSSDPAYVVLRESVTRTIGGMASFMEIRPVHGSAEIGHIWLGRTWQRTVFATEVLSLMMHHVMDTLGYRRIEWKCNAMNLASRRAALRLGFRFEGIFLNHMIVNGFNRDTAWFSITDEEWPAVRDAHRRWLSDDNFDGNDRQIVSLSTLCRDLW